MPRDQVGKTNCEGKSGRIRCLAAFCVSATKMSLCHFAPLIRWQLTRIFPKPYDHPITSPSRLGHRPLLCLVHRHLAVEKATHFTPLRSHRRQDRDFGIDTPPALTVDRSIDRRKNKARSCAGPRRIAKRNRSRFARERLSVGSRIDRSQHRHIKSDR